MKGSNSWATQIKLDCSYCSYIYIPISGIYSVVYILQYPDRFHCMRVKGHYWYICQLEPDEQQYISKCTSRRKCSDLQYYSSLEIEWCMQP